MTALEFSTARGALTIVGLDGEIEMNGPAWDLPNLVPLWLPGPLRGGDLVMPGSRGRRAYQRIHDSAAYSLALTVTGRYDPQNPSGCPDYWTQLEANLLFLQEQLLELPFTIRGTRAATLTMPSGDERVADITILGITPGRVEQGVLLGTFDISIPSGQFLEAP